MQYVAQLLVVSRISIVSLPSCVKRLLKIHDRPHPPLHTWGSLRESQSTFDQVSLFPAPLRDWLYAGWYGEDAHLLWILRLVPIFVAAPAVGPFVIVAWEVAGAVLTYLVWAGIATAVMTYLFVTFRGRHGEGHEARMPPQPHGGDVDPEKSADETGQSHPRTQEKPV